jgi:endogenous inhibitor of DNA gyrase (YacG/DUF329 family)
MTKGGTLFPQALQPAPLKSLHTWDSSVKLKCPICKEPTDSETTAEFPFCSARCRERDLGNWATGKYKVAAPIMDESELDEIETNERPQPESSDNDDE